MNTADYRDWDRRGIWHPYTRQSELREDFPVMVRGEGPFLWDSDGRRYFDAVSSWWACQLGHGHPRIVEAIRRQAGRLQHSILGNLSHPGAAELAVRIAELFPEPDRRVLFASDGASAVEAALKIALQYWHNRGRPGRRRFASLREAYHGDTLGAVSVGYLPGFHKPFESVLFPVHRADSPFCAACAWGRTPEGCDAPCFASMQRILDEHSPELAAVIVEPLCQCAAGMRMHPPVYLQRLADACRERDVLLIADEIAVGMGRTGRMFAFEHAGIDPDIVCLGKGITAGCLPLSATVATRAIYDTFADEPDDRTFYHGHTFAGNPIACAAALETLAVYREESIPDRARELGAVMREEFERLRPLPGVSGVRTLGVIGAFETPAAPALRRALLLEDGILIRPLGRTVYLLPPLNSPPDLVRDTVRILGARIARA